MVETFILNTDPLDSRELFEQLLEQVDDTRKEKILKLRTFTKQKQSLGAGLLIKKYVGDIHSLNKNGKPKNNNTEFNISHSGKYVVLTKGGTVLILNLCKEVTSILHQDFLHLMNVYKLTVAMTLIKHLHRFGL